MATTNQPPRSIVLYDGEVAAGTTNCTTLRNYGDLVMEAQDVGDGPASYLGGSTGRDYEWFVTVKAKDKRKLARLLGVRKTSELLPALERKFGGRSTAAGEYRRFLVEHDVPFEFFCW